jgi:histidinol dehydrogenase
MELIKYPKKENWKEIIKRPAFDNAALEKTVENVLSDIKTIGQAAVKRYTLQFDNVNIENVLVTEVEFLEAVKLISEDLKNAIQLAKNNIDIFHASQKEEVKIIETVPGVKCWRKSVAIQKVGLYIRRYCAFTFNYFNVRCSSKISWLQRNYFMHPSRYKRQY